MRATGNINSNSTKLNNFGFNLMLSKKSFSALFSPTPLPASDVSCLCTRYIGSEHTSFSFPLLISDSTHHKINMAEKPAPKLYNSSVSSFWGHDSRWHKYANWRMPCAHMAQRSYKCCTNKFHTQKYVRLYC